MKTIPLKTLLESVTPLPWHDKSWPPIQGKQFWANQAYRRHCCNHFPELVAVAREFQTCVQRDWHVPQELCDRMAKILATAETVQTINLNLWKTKH